MGLKESCINLCADKITEAFDNANNLGEVLSTALGTSTPEAGSNIIGMGTIINNVLNNFQNGLYTSMQPVAIAISMIFFLISIIELANSDRFSLEQFIKFFSKFVISFFLIVNCKALVEGINEFGTDFMGLIGGASINGDELSGTGEFRTSIVNAFEDAEDISFMDPLIIMVVTVAPMSLATMAMTVVAYVVAASRAIELIIRSSMMPIAFGLISDDGWRGAGGRYIKKYLALVTQGAVLVLIGKVVNAIMGEVGKTLIDIMHTADTKEKLYAAIPVALIIIVSVGFAAVTTMFKSIGIVNDVFGA